MNRPNRPALRYHGGKWRLAPWVISHFPEHERYIEPFCGAASVLMRKKRADTEVINDLSSHVVNFFRVLRDPQKAEQLKHQLELTPYSREEYQAACGIVAKCPIENARLLVVRSFMSYGSSGIFRANSGFRGLCTSRKPSQFEWSEWPQEIPYFIDRLRGVVIENQAAPKVIERYASPQTLFYVDPPYVHSTQRDQRNKYDFEMTDDDHRELAEQLRSVEGMVIISGYPSELYDELYSDWQMVSKPHVANCAKKTNEVLWISPNALVHQELF